MSPDASFASPFPTPPDPLPASGRPANSARPLAARRQILWLIVIRVVLVTTLLLSALLIQAITGIFFEQLNPIYYIVAVTYLLTALYVVLGAVGRFTTPLLYLQLVGDLLIVTALTYYSGGLDSAFPFLYILPIIAASILLTRRGALLLSLVACVLYGALVALIYNGVVTQPTGFLGSIVFRPIAPAMNQVYYNLFLRWIGFVATAFLASAITEKLRETGRILDEASADLEKLQVFYEDVINSVDSGLMTTDLNGRIGSLNHAGEIILGRSLGEVAGLSVDEVLGADGALGRRITGVGRDPLRFESRLETGDRGRKDLEVTVAQLFDRTNLHRGFTVVVRDLTLLKALEREVRVKDRMAAVGEMGAGIAHEIRNPLASVSGSIQLLRQDLDLTGDQRTLMDIVVRESDRLNRIIEEFLFYAKPSPPVPKQVDVGQLVDETVALLRNSSELSAGHSVLVVRAGEDLTCHCDPDQLRQVVWNLLRNAVQAMRGGGRLWVRIHAQASEGVELVVEDEGTGFVDEESLEHVWEPFRSYGAKGAGLGLAIVYRIVRDHGGRVSISNRPTGGARVGLWLPRRLPAEPFTSFLQPEGGSPLGIPAKVTNGN